MIERERGNLEEERRERKRERERERGGEVNRRTVNSSPPMFVSCHVAPFPDVSSP